jgi:hypothetical protein
MNAFWMSLMIAWTLLVWGLSSRPEMSICVATSLRGTFFRSKGQRERDRMEAELPDVRAVPLQLPVHLAHPLPGGAARR